MIYLGPLYRKEDEKDIISCVKCGLSNAPNRFQYALLEGFAENEVEKLSLINVLPVGIWPKNCTKLKLPTKSWRFGNHPCYELGCINLPFIKQKQRERACTKLLKQLCRTDREVLVYSCYLPFLRAAGKLPDDVKITLIVTDLPEFYDLGKTSLLMRILRKLNNRQIYKCLEHVDRFVLLTEAMAAPLKVGDRPYIVVEGVCNPAEQAPATEESGEKIVFYSGTLHEQFGIKKLVDGFCGLDDKAARLWICGSGDSEDYIKARAEEDERIKFFGFVNSQQVNELRSRATVLVNPRSNEGEYTKYSFPSKTMEYMASAIPTVMYKLDGIPREYDDYLVYIRGDKAEDIGQALKSVFDLDRETRSAMGAAAKSFVLKNKSGKNQAKKILDLLSR